jgi:hypothetical protein
MHIARFAVPLLMDERTWIACEIELEYPLSN